DINIVFVDESDPSELARLVRDVSDRPRPDFELSSYSDRTTAGSAVAISDPEPLFGDDEIPAAPLDDLPGPGRVRLTPYVPQKEINLGQTSSDPRVDAPLDVLIPLNQIFRFIH